MKKPKTPEQIVDEMSATRASMNTRMVGLIAHASHGIADLDSAKVACVTKDGDCYVFVSPTSGDTLPEVTIYELREGQNTVREVFLIGDVFYDFMDFLNKKL